MQAFKAALRLIFRSPLYLVLYIVFFGLLGVIIVASSVDSYPSSSDQLEREGVRPNVAIIDRDDSEVSRALSGFYAERGTPIELEDSSLALQTATALNRASYIVIIPEGYGETFVEAARADTTLPALETIVNYAESDAIYLDLVTTEYLSALRLAAAGSMDASASTLVKMATEATELQVAVEAADIQITTSAGTSTVFYFQWMAYPVTTGLMVLTGIVFSNFQSGELRRRNLCSPLSPTKLNAQVALGSVSLVLMSWAFLVLLSLLPFCGGFELLTQSPLTFGLLALAALVYALVPFSIGFLLSQFGLKEIAINGAANIVGLSFCFLSGVFMGSAAALNETIQVVAHAIPTYWYSEALLLMRTGVTDASVLTTYFSYLGIIALFALVLFSLAILVGQRRARSADAGGNPAAEARY